MLQHGLMPGLLFTSSSAELAPFESIKPLHTAMGTFTFSVASAPTLPERPFTARRAHEPGPPSRLTPDPSGGKQVEESLQDRACQLQALMASSIDAAFITDEQARIVAMNPAAEQLLRYTSDQLVGQPVERIVAPGDRRQFRRLMLPGPSPGPGTHVRHPELMVLRRDGTTIPVEASVAEGQVNHVRRRAIVMHDLSHRKRLEEEILETETLQREQIGADLHDDVGQLLTGIGLLCRRLQQRLAARGMAEAEAVLRIEALVKETTTKVRLLGRELVSAPLKAAELPAALLDLAARVEYLFDVHCRFDPGHAPLLLDDFTAAHLYRIAQEACHNAVKHGKASRIRISLGGDGTAHTLTVCDDGCGLSKPPTKASGLGLRLMRHRAQRIGATLDIKTNEHSGVSVTCTLPVNSFTDHPPNAESHV